MLCHAFNKLFFGYFFKLKVMRFVFEIKCSVMDSSMHIIKTYTKTKNTMIHSNDLIGVNHDILFAIFTFIEFVLKSFPCFHDFVDA